jgi:hypothetical protein
MPGHRFLIQISNLRACKLESESPIFRQRKSLLAVQARSEIIW